MSDLVVPALAVTAGALLVCAARAIGRRSRDKLKTDAIESDDSVDEADRVLRDRCANPDCVRCKNYARFTGPVLSAALERVKRRLDLVSLPRIDAAIARSREAEQAVSQRPTVLFVPGLTARAVWIGNRAFEAATASSDAKREKLSAAVRPLLDAIELVREEVEDFVFDCAARGDMRGWRANDCERGSWDVFPLVSQGVVFRENTDCLPRTWRALEAVSGSACAVGARRSCFGNAFVSVLGPDTAIAPHCGPTNARLRVHVPVRLPRDAASSLSAGSDDLLRLEPSHWLAFDDSFTHAARNDSPTEDRIVLIVDLWHVDLSDEERDAIAELFPSV